MMILKGRYFKSLVKQSYFFYLLYACLSLSLSLSLFLYRKDTFVHFFVLVQFGMPREENVIVRQAWKDPYSLQKLEKDLFYSLVSKSLKILPASRRAAVAIVLRFGSLSRDIPVDSTRSLLDFLQYIEVSGASNLQILYIQRAKQANDPWSGHIAFPGGRQEGNEKDIETAIRETKEEVGLDLGNWRHFICIGRLSDREIRLRNRSLNDSAYCAFGT